MADLIATGYDDEETALRAAEEVERLSQDLIIEPEAVAVIIRDQKGKYKVITKHHPVATGVTWGMFWACCSASCSSSRCSALRSGACSAPCSA